MTPEERAEKIYDKYGRKGSWNLFDKRMIDAIATEIRAAVEEAHMEIVVKQALVHGEAAMVDGKLITNEELYKQPTDYIREARNEAFEEAAKVAEKGHSAGGVINCNGDVREDFLRKE